MERAEFERMNQGIFNLCLQCTDKALLTAGIEPAALDQVVLVGGSTRIPKVSISQQIYQSVEVKYLFCWGQCLWSSSPVYCKSTVFVFFFNDKVKS